MYNRVAHSHVLAPSSAINFLPLFRRLDSEIPRQFKRVKSTVVVERRSGCTNVCNVCSFIRTAHSPGTLCVLSLCHHTITSVITTILLSFKCNKISTHTCGPKGDVCTNICTDRRPRVTTLYDSLIVLHSLNSNNNVYSESFFY